MSAQEAKAYGKGFLRGQAYALTQRGVPVSEVSSVLNVPRRTIYFWLRRGYDQPDEKSTGRPRVTSCRTDRLISRVVQVDPSTSLSEISGEANVSRSTSGPRIKKDNSLIILFLCIWRFSDRMVECITFRLQIEVFMLCATLFETHCSRHPFTERGIMPEACSRAGANSPMDTCNK